MSEPTIPADKDDLTVVLSNCDAKRDHNYRLGGDSFSITTREYAALVKAARHYAALLEGPDGNDVASAELHRVPEVAFEHAMGTLQGMVERAADHPEEMNRISARVEGVLLEMLNARSECEHEWVSARNEVVTSGEMCPKCFAVRAEPSNTESAIPLTCSRCGDEWRGQACVSDCPLHELVTTAREGSPK